MDDGPSKKKRRTFTIKEKVELVEESMTPGYCQARAAEKHGIKQSTLAGILREKDKLLATTSASRMKAKNFSKGKESELEDKLYEWFLKKRSQGLILSDPLLR